ncbi:hypothetical protein Q5Y75_16225 [Ruegeria sp. 2205SS24-7]|uniref:thermonuclease family protein n=1 Tax=Ruegeria discodermiae TaxID=3064389 RepID=UPI0027419D3C|nr:hypothetical protein [Ruegeria sp. 2205SS24-7]MDP5218777.1 hypothetical protein [Ruegeria sp. 2205SS24-7]
MQFPPDQRHQIQGNITRALSSVGLNEWERKFLGDMQSKFRRYGNRTRLSDKQFSTLTRVLTKSSIDHRSQGRVRKKARRRLVLFIRSIAGFTLFALIAITVAALVLPQKAAERFPEYFSALVQRTAVGTVEGRVTHVRDGDTIEVEGVPIRFGSLDCAERYTTKGKQATNRMRNLTARPTLICYLNGRTSYDRKIGSCTLPDGRDLASVMIREGYCGRYW